MTVVEPISDKEPRATRSGRLVLVVGPSGAGKDTLIGWVQAACVHDERIVFPRRAVTRQGSAHEPNETLSPADFAQAAARGDFALHWQAHGLSYGVRSAIDQDLSAGRTVVVNVSRTVVSQARQAYPHVTVVLITASPDVLAERLAARNRESDGRIDDRLRRSVDETAFAPDVTISNTGRMEDHARELLAVVRGDHAAA